MRWISILLLAVCLSGCGMLDENRVSSCLTLIPWSWLTNSPAVVTNVPAPVVVTNTPVETKTRSTMIWAGDQRPVYCASEWMPSAKRLVSVTAWRRAGESWEQIETATIQPVVPVRERELITASFTNTAFPVPALIVWTFQGSVRHDFRIERPLESYIVTEEDYAQ